MDTNDPISYVERFVRLPLGLKILTVLVAMGGVASTILGAALFSSAGKDGAHAWVCSLVSLPICQAPSKSKQAERQPERPTSPAPAPQPRPVASQSPSPTPAPAPTAPPPAPTPTATVAATPPAVELTPHDPCTAGAPSAMRRQFCAILECGQVAKSDDGAAVVLDWLQLAEKYTRAAASADARVLSHDLVDFKVYQSAGNLKRTAQGHGQRDLACIERQQAFLGELQSVISTLRSKARPGGAPSSDVRQFLDRHSVRID